MTRRAGLNLESIDIFDVWSGATAEVPALVERYGLTFIATHNDQVEALKTTKSPAAKLQPFGAAFIVRGPGGPGPSGIRATC